MTAAQTLLSLQKGPGAYSRDNRQTLAQSVTNRAAEYFGTELIFCALYGSMARQTDGPFSDVELFCAIRTGDFDCRVYEWIESGIKVKLRVYTQQALEKEAGTVGPEWSLSHNKFFHHQILFGEPVFAERLCHLIGNVPDSDFKRAITQLYLAEIFELLAKMKNLCRGADPVTNGIGPVLVKLLEQTALLLGMAARQCFSTRQRLLTEAVALNLLPGAYTELCRRALEGQWQDTARLNDLIDSFQAGLSRLLHERQLADKHSILPFYPSVS